MSMMLVRKAAKRWKLSTGMKSSVNALAASDWVEDREEIARKSTESKARSRLNQQLHQRKRTYTRDINGGGGGSNDHHVTSGRSRSRQSPTSHLPSSSGGGGGGGKSISVSSFGSISRAANYVKSDLETLMVSIDRANIDELVRSATPPPGFEVALQVILTLLGSDPSRVKYWKAARKEYGSLKVLIARMKRFNVTLEGVSATSPFTFIAPLLSELESTAEMEGNSAFHTAADASLHLLLRCMSMWARCCVETRKCVLAQKIRDRHSRYK
mmetsp:Transcript_19784/g.50606  ORF Transcript_19784/g.50606 Transcript_19784/m.50606 type:complete len:270 (-) Transcript_19784:254-1063(-)